MHDYRIFFHRVWIIATFDVGIVVNQPSPELDPFQVVSSIPKECFTHQCEIDCFVWLIIGGHQVVQQPTGAFGSFVDFEQLWSVTILTIRLEHEKFGVDSQGWNVTENLSSIDLALKSKNFHSPGIVPILSSSERNSLVAPTRTIHEQW